MNLQPPTPFSFAKSDEWLKWKRWFEQYRQTSGLVDKDEQRQVSTLLYCLGEEAEEVLDMTCIYEDDRKKYQKVVDEFDKYFKVRKDVIYERAWFNQRNQLSDEPADRFITEVHKLAENCEFGPMKEELICDRLVVGIHDLSLSERLQLEPDLTLDKTKRLIRQWEAVKSQQDILQKPKVKEELPLEAVRQKPVRRKLPALPQTSARPPPKNCRKCGSATHPKQSCPARDATCFRCNRRGHFSSQCLSNTIALVTTQPEQPQAGPQQQDQEMKYLDTVENDQQNFWEVQVSIDDAPVKFKVDTGAEVTVISEGTWKSLELKKPLQQSNVSLCGPDRTQLKVLGKILLDNAFMAGKPKRLFFIPFTT